MALVKFRVDQTLQAIGLYHDPSNNNEALSDPLGHLDKVIFHPELRYPGVVATLTGTLSLAAAPTTPEGYITNRTVTLGAHGQTGKPMILGRIHSHPITSNDVTWAGSIPVQQADITGDTTSYVRWLTLGCDSTNVLVYESLMNKNLGYQLGAVDIDYTIYVFDRNLDATLPNSGPLLMSNATGAMVIETPKGSFSMHKRYLRAATTGSFYLPGGRTVMIKNNVNAPPNDDEVTWRCWHGSAAGFDVKNEWHYNLTGGAKPFTASPVASWTPPVQRVAL